MSEETRKSEQFATPANLLTFSRLLLLPVVLVGVVTHHGYLTVGAMLVVVVTDLLDGRVARRLRQAGANAEHSRRVSGGGDGSGGAAAGANAEHSRRVSGGGDGSGGAAAGANAEHSRRVSGGGDGSGGAAAGGFGKTLDSTVDFVLIYSLFIAFYAAGRLATYQFAVLYLAMLTILTLQFAEIASASARTATTAVGKLTGALEYAYLLFLVAREAIRPTQALEAANIGLFSVLALAIVVNSSLCVARVISVERQLRA